MDVFVNHQKKSFFLSALLLAILLVSLKWILSYIYFDEDIVLRIINDSTDGSYYPIINSFSDFNLSPSYSEVILDLKVISFPILALFVNLFFFKIIGSYSFIFLEIICTAFFILIFNNILQKLSFSFFFTIICSIFLFILPTFLIDLSFLGIKTLDLLAANLQQFYSMRFPRPIISNLFFFAFIYFVIDFFLKKEDYFKSFYFFSILMGITINVFFYLFFIEFFLLIIVFFFKFKIIFFEIILKNFKHLFASLIIFLFFVIIFQLQIFYSEPDYIERLGVFYLNTNQKIILFEYLIKFLFGKNFIFLFTLNTAFFFMIKNKPIRIFYFLFLSSILSPIFFFFIFNKGVDYYHFFNWVVIAGFLFPTICFLYLIDLKFFQKYNLKNLSKFLLIFMLLYFNISNGLKYQNSAIQQTLVRSNLSDVTNFINNNKFLEDKNLEVLNLNIKLSNWFLLNDYKNFSLIPIFFWTPKKTETLENELISSLKFLKLSKNDFYDLIKNKRQSWRFKNNFVYNYFGRNYLANSLVTFNKNKDDFEDIEKKYIKSNNLIITHQVIIPKAEFLRLLNKFDNMNTEINPDIVILDKNGFIKITELENNDYCQIFDNKLFIIYISKKLKSQC